MSNYIAPYILRSEAECQHCQKMPPDLVRGGGIGGRYPEIYEHLFDCFKRWRERWGRPIKIGCIYRCPIHNLEIGGELASAHLFAAGIDSDFDSVLDTRQASRLLVEVNPDLRIGTYTETGSFIHFDVAYMIFPRMDKDWVRGVRWSK